MAVAIFLRSDDPDISKDTYAGYSELLSIKAFVTMRRDEIEDGAKKSDFRSCQRKRFHTLKLVPISRYVSMHYEAYTVINILFLHNGEFKKELKKGNKWTQYAVELYYKLCHRITSYRTKYEPIFFRGEHKTLICHQMMTAMKKLW